MDLSNTHCCQKDEINWNWNWNKLYGWPSLLFSDKHEVWNKYGLSDLNHLSAVQQKHSKSQTHVQCCLTSKLFGKE